MVKNGKKSQKTWIFTQIFYEIGIIMYFLIKNCKAIWLDIVFHEYEIRTQIGFYVPVVLRFSIFGKK